MTETSTVGDLRRAIAHMDDDTVLFFSPTLGADKGTTYPVEAFELVPGDPPILEFLGPRIKGQRR